MESPEFYAEDGLDDFDDLVDDEFMGAEGGAAAGPSVRTLEARLRQLQLQRDKELSEQIQLAELLEQTETELRREKAGHEAARTALKDHILKLQSVTKERDDAVARSESLKAQYALDVESLKDFHSREIKTLCQHIENLEATHQGETAGLRGKIANLQHELAGVAWTDRHVQELSVLSIEEVFVQLLAARNSPTCQGLVRRLAELLESQDADGWIAESAWAERVCRVVEELRGGGTSSEMCALLSGIPKLVPGMLRSAVLSCLADVLSLQSVHPVPQDGAPSRFQASPADWAATRSHIATTFRNCLAASVPTEEEQLSIAARFVALPGVLAALTAMSSGEAARRSPEADILLHCAEALKLVCRHAYHSEGITKAIFELGGVAALNTLAVQPASQGPALAALAAIPHDVNAMAKMIAAGCLKPLIAILRDARPRQLMAKAGESSPVLVNVIGLLSRLSQSTAFPAAFLEHNGPAALMDLHPNDVELSLRLHIVEILVNVLLLQPQAIVTFAECGAFSLIVDVPSIAPPKSALLFRSLEVTAAALQAIPRLATKISASHVKFWASLLDDDFHAYFFQVAFLFQHYAASLQCSFVYLLEDDALHAIAKLFGAMHNEVQAWIISVASSALVSAIALPSDSPYFPHRDPMLALHAAIWRMLPNARTAAIKASAAVSLLQTLSVLSKYPGADNVSDLKGDRNYQELSPALAAFPQKAALATLLASMATNPVLHPILQQLSGAMSDLIALADPALLVPLEELMAALWAAEYRTAIGTEDARTIAAVDSGLLTSLLGPLVKVAMLPSSKFAPEILLEISYAHRFDGFLAAMAAAGGVVVIAKLMKEEDMLFRKELLTQPATAERVLRDAGLAHLLEILRLSPDMSVQMSIAETLPEVFNNETVCCEVAAAGVVSHIIALVETSPSQIELATGLRIMDKITQHGKATIGLIKNGGLRVLVDITLMQQMAGGRPYSDFIDLGGFDDEGEGESAAKPKVATDVPMAAEPILARVLGEGALRHHSLMYVGYGADIAGALEYDNGVPILLSLLDQTESPSLAEMDLKLLRDLSLTSASRELLHPEAVQTLVNWSQRSHDDDESKPPAWFDSVRECSIATLVNIAWNVQSAKTRDQQITVLATLVDNGALPAFAIAIAGGLYTDEAIEADPKLAEKRELARKALWAVATWLSHEPQNGRATFVRSQGLCALLQVEETNSTAEMRTFARVALSKLLCALGEDLTTRIHLLKAQVMVAKDPTVLWEQLAATFGDS